jgi:hypothetical protein
MLCPLRSADFGCSGLKPHRRVILPLRSLLNANAGDGKRSIGKDSSFRPCSFRPWLRSTFVAKPRFTVVKLQSRRLYSDLAGGNGGGGGGGGGGGRRGIYPPPDDDIWSAIIQALLISLMFWNLYMYMKRRSYRYNELSDIDDG